MKKLFLLCIGGVDAIIIGIATAAKGLGLAFVF